VVIEGVAELPYAESGRPAATWLGVPLLHRGQAIGVMAAQDYRNARAYGDEELQVLTFVAGQVALAIERRRADTELRKSEEKFKSLFELSPLGISQIDWLGRFLQINPAFARMVGRTPADIMSLTYWDITPRKYEAQEFKVLEEVQKHGHFGPFEKEYIHRDGHLVPVVLHALLVRAPDGEDQLWGIVEDITERKRAEELVRRSEEKFRALFESTSTGVMIHDERQYLEMNPAAVRMLGYASFAELAGKHPVDTSPEFQPNGRRSADLARHHIDECLQAGTSRFEWVARRADGTEIPLDVILTRIEMEGRPVIQAVVTDNSQRKRAEAELLKALGRERELSQLKNNFVSMVSHEFRTPLGVIQSSAEILHDYLDRLAPDERQEHLASITKNTRRMAGLMEEVLVLGRLDAGKLPFDPSPVDLAVLLTRLVDEAHSATDYLSPIELRAENLPALVRIDEKLVTHILSNLLSNAVKYSPPGTPVEFSAQLRQHQLEFCVRDRGIGVPESDQPRLFEAFHRGANVGHRAGTGLGLVIVKRCVELHGGRLELKSRLGEGTTVTVWLPALEPAAN
jgi:PAS domain S-box-containing protein